jgi:hypothetical protein
LDKFRVTIKIFDKIKIKIKIFLVRSIPTRRTLIHSIWINEVKVMKNFFCEQVGQKITSMYVF